MSTRQIIGVVRAFNSMRFKGLPIDFLRELEGKTVLEHSINRMKKAEGPDEVVLVTSDKEEDQIFIEIAKKCGIKYFVGKGEDYLIWVGQLTEELKPNWIIENIWTSPLFDFSMVKPLVKLVLESSADYIVNIGTIGCVLEIFPLAYNPKKLMGFYDRLANTLLPQTRELMESISLDLHQQGSLQYEDVKKNRGYLLYWLLAKKGKVECAKIDSLWQEYLTKNKYVKDSVLNTRLVPSKGVGFEIVRRIYENFYNPLEDLADLNKTFQSLVNLELISVLSCVIIEVTNHCELKCIMCPRTSKMTREIGYMNFDIFKKIIDEAEGLSIHFSGFGEPLLHPQIKEMLVYAKEKALEVGLWTNGLSLNEEFSRGIIEKELLDYIIFSLDATTRETYFKIKGVDIFDKVKKNVLKFLEIKSNVLKDKPKYYMSRNLQVGIQILKMKENDKEIEQFMEEWDYVGRVKKMINYQTRIQKGEAVEAEVWKMLYEKFPPVEHAIIGHFNSFCGQIEDKSVVDVTPIKRFPCRQIKEGILILWNGDVVMCQQDFNGDYVVGNIKEDSLVDVWNRLKDLRLSHLKGVYERNSLCAKCKEWYIPIV